MSLQMSPVQSPEDRVADLGSIDLSGIDGRQLRRSKFAGRFAEDGITLSLVHLDVALAVKAEGREIKEAAADVQCFKVFAKRLAHGSTDAVAASAVEGFEDPVIRRLSDALAATEATHDSHSAICADALRLAILTRQFSRQANSARADSAATENRPGRNMRSLQKWRLKRVLQYVDDHLDAKITLQDLATVAGLSRMHFAAQFRAAIGMRPHEYLLKRRIERAEELLKQAEVSLVDVALTVGFQTQAHFTTVFKRFAGDTPHQWRSAYLGQSAPLPPARMSLS
jgi:AraC family transcriptional regulator